MTARYDPALFNTHPRGYFLVNDRLGQAFALYATKARAEFEARKLNQQAEQDPDRLCHVVPLTQTEKE